MSETLSDEHAKLVDQLVSPEGARIPRGVFGHNPSLDDMNEAAKAIRELSSELQSLRERVTMLDEVLKSTLRVFSNGYYYTRTTGEGEDEREVSHWLFELDAIDGLSVDIETAIAKITPPSGDKP